MPNLVKAGMRVYKGEMETALNHTSSADRYPSMCLNEKRRLTIPPYKAYGLFLPPNAILASKPLIF